MIDNVVDCSMIDVAYVVVLDSACPRWSHASIGALVRYPYAVVDGSLFRQRFGLVQALVAYRMDRADRDVVPV